MTQSYRLIFGLTALALSPFLFMRGTLENLQDKVSAELIRSAWAETLETQAPVHPWPWMDTYPVAQLSVARLGKENIVMAGTSAAVAAFAPGWVDGTNKPGEPGIAVFSADGGSHFSYLKNLKIGDELALTVPGGQHLVYEVEDLRMLETQELQIQNAAQASILVLTTGYRLQNWDAQGDLRFVVIARQKVETLDVAGL